MKILFIQAGGTIDKGYPHTDENHGYAFEIDEPAVKRILPILKPSFEYEIVTVCRKDSLDMTDDDRVALRKACEESAVDRIVITHGTDTILKTAETLDGVPKKVIVLTGARKPELFRDSDAPINVGLAVGAAGTLKAGVYVALNGLVLPWRECRWDPKTRQFVKIG